jgi:short-subunit dehydrogenase
MVVNIARRECKYADVNICLSLREGEEIKKATDQILDMDEPIEAIINCVGVFSRESFGSISEDEIKRLMSTNLKAPMLLVSHLFERIKRDETDILNIISTAGVIGKKNEPVYSASKWAERGFTKSLQEELKDTPCRVISFCPGGIRTNFSEKALGFNASEETWMDPKDIASFIKNILDLPKNIEVSEIILNRK